MITNRNKFFGIDFKRLPGTAVLIATLGISATAEATLKDDIGFTDLQGALGPSIPQGSASVFQVEADAPPESNQWIADSSDSQFVGKTIADLNTNVPSASGVSGHATTVGRLFYGNNISTSPGVNDIGAHSVLGWLLDQTAPGGAYNTTTFSFTAIPAPTNRRIANHSWVGSGLNDPQTNNYSPGLTASWLRHNDWLSDVDELIQVVGANNGSTAQVMMATSMNSIVVGRTSGIHAQGVVAVDSTYIAGRPAISLVVPSGVTSYATPSVSSAVALLIDAASLNPGWSEASTTNRLGTTIYNAERTETIKAALMAGASRWTINTSGQGDIDSYRVDAVNQTDNGLDWRYGAGQLHIHDSYQILAAGEHASLEDGGNNSIGYRGFDHDEAFGGAMGSNSVATYDLGLVTQLVDLSVSLAWNLRIFETGTGTFDESATLYDLDLELVDVSAGNSVVAQSNSAIDNTENIWFTLEPGHYYQLRVKQGSGQANFNWDYAIAWSTSSPQTIIPVPTLYAFALALLLALLVHRHQPRH